MTADGTLTVSNANISGNINMTGGTINWSYISGVPTIPTLPNYIESTKITHATIESPSIYGGTITIGNGDDVFKAGSIGIYAGHNTMSSAPFRVYMDGRVVASNIHITGGSIDVTNDVSIGRYLRLSATSFDAGIKFGTVGEIFSDPAAEAITLSAPVGGVWAGDNRLDQPIVARWG